jgi:drug/metabolite transporter (DMT)-like permease
MDKIEDKKTQFYAIAALILSLLAYAFVPVLIRWCEIEISPEATMFNRFWMATLILAAGQILRQLKQKWTQPNNQGILPSQDKNKSGNITLFLQPKILILLIITTVASSGGSVVWGWSLQETSVANSSLMHNLTPLFTTIVGWLFFQSQFAGRFILGTLIAVGGTVALGINDFQLDIHKIQGDILAVISAVMWGISLLGSERLRNNFNSNFIVFGVCFAGIILTLISALVLGEPLFPTSIQGWFSALALAIIGQILGLGFLTYSLNYLSAELVALVFLLDPILTAIAAWFSFAETLNLSSMIAFGVVIFGIYLGVTNMPTKSTSQTNMETSQT